MNGLPAQTIVHSSQFTLERVRTRMLVVVAQPDRLLLMQASLQRTVSKIVKRVSSFPGGWTKGRYSSKTFCSCCWIHLFWKSRSFVYWVKLLKIPFCVIWFNLLITQLCSWNKSKHAAVVQHCRPPLSLTMEEMTWLHSHNKTIKSLNATKNVVWPTLKVPSYAEYLDVLCYVTNNTEIMLWIHSGKNAAAEENLNKSGKD